MYIHTYTNTHIHAHTHSFSWNTPISIPGRATQAGPATQAPPYEVGGGRGEGGGEGRSVVNPQCFGRNDGVAVQIWETMLEITKGNSLKIRLIAKACV